jgi:MFS family permease
MFGVKINRTLQLLMLSDVFLVVGFGLIAPILAIFIKENMVGGSIFAAGLASTVFLVTKSVIQLPFSRYVDGQKNKVKWLIMGTFLFTFVPIIYIFSTHIWHIYIAQFIYGIGSALAYPTWLGLWSTHLDKKHESFEWGFYSTTVGLVAAGTAAIGAAIAQYIGFTYTFIFVGLMSLCGAGILFKLNSEKEPQPVRSRSYHGHRSSRRNKQV